MATARTGTGILAVLLLAVGVGACDKGPVRVQQREHCKMAAERSVRKAASTTIERVHAWEIEDSRNVSVIITARYDDGRNVTTVVKCRYRRTPKGSPVFGTPVIRATGIAINGAPLGRTELGLYNSAIERSL